MRSVPRTRHYVSPGALTLGRPVLSFDYAREAYILRGIGGRVGPVLREDRRRGPSANGYAGPERRGVVGGGQPRVKVAPTPRTTARPTAAASARSKAAGQTRSKASRRPRSKNARG